MDACISNSPWASYIKEREKAEVYETSKGFAIYKIEDKTVYISDIWVHPDFRNQHIATDIADAVAAIAKEQGCTQMLGSVCPTAKHSHQSLKVLIAYGMYLLSAQHNIIYFTKDI